MINKIKGWSFKCFEDWMPYVKLGIPGFLMVIMEWLCFECGIFFTGNFFACTYSKYIFMNC